jgi:GTP-binding protein EngB required for normal cell division
MNFLKKWKLLNYNGIDANRAYNYSVFGEKYPTKQAIKAINKFIKSKIQKGDLSLIVDSKNIEIDKEIVKYYENLGYNVVLINNKLHDKINGEYIFISWDQSERWRHGNKEN